MDEHADCGCGCDGAGTCQPFEEEFEIETPCGDIEVEVEFKPRYREVGEVTKTLLGMAKELISAERLDRNDPKLEKIINDAQADIFRKQAELQKGLGSQMEKARKKIWKQSLQGTGWTYNELF